MRRLLLVLLVGLLIVGSGFAEEKLTLEESIQIALEKSPAMLKVKAEIKAAEGAAGQAVAGFLPQLSVQGSLGKYYSEPSIVEITMGSSASAFSFGTNEQADLVKCSASLSQAIFSGGRLLNSIGMANKGLDAAKHELRKVTYSITFDVIRAYYNVLKAKKFVELSSQSVLMARNHFNRVENFIKAGMSTRADLLRTEVQLAKAELNLTKAQQAYEIAQSSFNNVLGRDLDALVDLAEIEFNNEDIPVYAYSDLLKIAYKERPDWQQYLLGKGVAEDEVRIAYSALLPSVSLIGNYERGSTSYSSYQSDTNTWTALVSGSWNIFDGTATFNKIKETKAKLKAKKADEVGVSKAIALEVREANYSLKNAKENLAGAGKALELAGENYEIAEQRFKAGVGTNLEEIDAQVALTQSRIDYLDAQHELQIARAKLNKVIGREIYTVP